LDKPFSSYIPSLETTNYVSALQDSLAESCCNISLSNRGLDLHRRPVEVKEKLYLLESNIAVSEMQCDLGKF